MFNWIKRKNGNDTSRKIEDMNEYLKNIKWSEDILENEESLKKLFKDVDTVKYRSISNEENPGIKFLIAFSDEVASTQIVNEDIIKPLMISSLDNTALSIDYISENIIKSGEVAKAENALDIVSNLTYGDTVLFMNGSSTALVINSKGFALRSPSEPVGEKVLYGPREGFTEGIMLNISLVRRRLRTHKLKLKFYTIGRETKTSICVAYMDNIADKEILREALKRLDAIDIDGILDANYLKEHISEQSALGFSTMGETERPDVVVSKLLEGRIAIFVDGTPMVLTLPFLFIENFQTNEDYYMHFYYTSISRFLRMLGFFFTAFVPAVYVALISHHQEILPEGLLVMIAAERENVSLPGAIEAIILLLVFDLLKETVIRVPTYMGQALSIAGALVIGQGAVEARLISSMMLIIVGFTGVTTLLVPKMYATVFYMRYVSLILSAMLGFLGVYLTFSLMAIHILNLKSFGVDQIIFYKDFSWQHVKDIFARFPWPLMVKRTPAVTDNEVRASEKIFSGE